MKRARPAAEDDVRHVSAVHEAVDEFGRRMVNEYSIVRPLGRGSFGEVSLVEHLQTGKRYALKQASRPRLKPALSLGPFGGPDAGDGSLVDDPVRREIAVLKKLSHRHIVRLHEVLDDPTSARVFLVLTYADEGQLLGGPSAAHGATPADHSAPKPTSGRPAALDEAEARAHVRALLCALEHMHARGVTHGDLKPENLLVDAQRALLVADFGLSRIWRRDAEGESDEAGGAPESGGTPAFCCPERLLGGLEGLASLAAADLWAVGVCLHCMLAGTPPFAARSVAALLEKIEREPPELARELSPDARDLIGGLLAKDPAQRTTLVEAAAHAWVCGSGSGGADGAWSLERAAATAAALAPPEALEPTDAEIARAVSPLDRLVSLVLLRARFGAAVTLQKVIRGRLARLRSLGSLRTVRSAVVCLQMYYRARESQKHGQAGAILQSACSALASLFWGCHNLGRRRKRPLRTA
jgi:serine/threonine protein kinase